MNYVQVVERRTRAADLTTNRASRYALPISKLHQVPYRARLALKVHRITTCEQLLAAAGETTARAALAKAAQLEPDLLDLLVRRADMARVHGIGVVFGLMLEELGVIDVASVAAADPVELHDRLRRYNGEERRARRSPTPEEVVAWVTEARSLPILMT
jgi:predicted flap endonuclease-1-like 5' DNA nuclease